MRPNGSAALQDTDTAYLLKIIRSNPDPVSHVPQSVWNWFKGDWPLHNHFYRPISTLSFEMDTRLHGDNGSGYVLTNALIAASCILLLFWFLREITDSPLLTGLASTLFGLWSIGFLWPKWVLYVPLVVVVLGFARRPTLLALVVLCAFAPIWLLPVIALTSLVIAKVLKIDPQFKTNLLPTILAAGVAHFFLGELTSPVLSSAVVGWIPGRTASIMTLFCLIAMAAYARYERLSAPRAPEPSKTPLDPPATRNTRVGAIRTVPQWPWLFVALIGLTCALGSHEQAVMLPGALVGVGVSMRLQGYKIRWVWPVAAIVLLGGYLLLRREILPHGVSSYQAQQLRTGSGFWGALGAYFFPAAIPFQQSLASTLGESADILMGSVLYDAFWLMFTNVAAFIEARRQWIPALTGWALSFIAFLPMAWVKPFPHYDYWPLAMRSLMVAALGVAAFQSALIAWSPRAIRLPARRVPAPGSLPRP